MFCTFSKAQLKNAVSNIAFLGGSSNLANGLNVARTNQFTSANGDRPTVQNIAIFITDGFDSSDSQTNAVSEAALSKAAGIVIFGVGLLSASGILDSPLYLSIASFPQQMKPSFYPVSNYPGLNSAVVDALVARTCVSSANVDCSRKVGLSKHFASKIFDRF